MMADRISKSLLLALNTDLANVTYDAVYGGETLVNRALIALSKAGVRDVKVICSDGQREHLSTLLSAVRRRLTLDYEIVELRAGEALTEKIARLIEPWNDPFLFFTSDNIVHSTLMTQAVQLTGPTTPMLLAYKNVWVQDGQVAFASVFPEKFKIIFANVAAFTKIAAPSKVFQQTTVTLDAAEKVAISPEVENGIVSVDVAICRRADLQGVRGRTFLEIVQRWNDCKSLTIGFVENAWWWKVNGKESAEQIREFFWKIAFKEISGEFSKLVNSRLSKPLTFLFVRLGFSPNMISILELALFFVSSLFLLLKPYWAIVVFAIVWQLAAGVLDRCDGEVARVRNYESDSGARFDMLIDDLRFGIPFVFLTIACYWESQQDPFYFFVAVVTFVWYVTAVIFHNRFLRRAGYVSIQAMGVDFLKTQEGTGWLKVFRKLQPFTKGDIRTFYIFLLAFLGHKSVLFWMLVAYAWPLGGSYFFTIRKFRLSSQPASVSR